MTDSTDNAPERIWIDDERPYGGECHVYTESTDGVIQYCTEYIRADLAPDPLRAVKVKPLEWECTDWSAGDGVKGENDCEWTAEVWPLTSYIVSWFGSDRFEVCTPSDEELKATSLEAAKAAAQADYETRIRSALEPDPQDARVAALVETMRNIAVVGYSDDPSVSAAIARQVVSQARAALAAFDKGGKDE